MIRSTMAYSASISATTTEQVKAIGTGGGGQPIADACDLGELTLECTSISSATALTVALAHDSGGDLIIGQRESYPIEVGATTGTDGSVVIPLNRRHVLHSSGTTGALYVLVATDAGTATILASIDFTERT